MNRASLALVGKGWHLSLVAGWVRVPFFRTLLPSTAESALGQHQMEAALKRTARAQPAFSRASSPDVLPVPELPKLICTAGLSGISWPPTRAPVARCALRAWSRLHWQQEKPSGECCLLGNAEGCCMGTWRGDAFVLQSRDVRTELKNLSCIHSIMAYAICGHIPTPCPGCSWQVLGWASAMAVWEGGAWDPLQVGWVGTHWEAAVPSLLKLAVLEWLQCFGIYWKAADFVWLLKLSQGISLLFSLLLKLTWRVLH